MSVDFASRVRVGATKERAITVGANMTTSFLWEGENVMSTPSMILEMEETCRLLLKEQAIPEKEWDSVGTIVDVKHLAATPVGAQVFLRAKVASIEGRRVMFEVEARDKLEQVGEGRHERFIINVPKFRAKFAEKQRELDA
jgi:predicted thioesterase